MSVSKMDMLTKKAVPMDLLFKGPEEQKVSKEEENTFILQVWNKKYFQEKLNIIIFVVI